MAFAIDLNSDAHEVPGFAAGPVFLGVVLDVAEYTSCECGVQAFAFLRRVLLLDIPHDIANRDEWVKLRDGLAAVHGLLNRQGIRGYGGVTSITGWNSKTK